MFEKVNPSHPDKIADRIAGAIVDLAYAIPTQENPKIAVEVLIGHGICTVLIETNAFSDSIITPHIERFISDIVNRIANEKLESIQVQISPQDEHLSKNQEGKIKCGDNGIFKGVPVSNEERSLCKLAKEIYKKWHYDGKYICDKDKVIICQSHASSEELKKIAPNAIVNPLGDWTGGTYVDSGATNRKLGSDMAQSVTGGGLHGKDLSKADVSVNIYAWLKAQETGQVVELSCAIGDEFVDGRPYSEIVDIAGEFIASIGGFEKFAEWGIVRA